jgi:hypothetical protein
MREEYVYDTVDTFRNMRPKHILCHYLTNRVLGTIQSLKLEPEPAVAIMPMGTGVRNSHLEYCDILLDAERLKNIEILLSNRK